MFIQTSKPFFKEPFSPLANHLAAAAELRGNLVVAQALGGEEDHLVADDLKIRQRILAGPS
jgi:hypothetical protein